jgi:hypothetical protein
VDANQTPTGALWVTDDARVQRSSVGTTASEIAILSRSNSAAASAKRCCV